MTRPAVIVAATLGAALLAGCNPPPAPPAKPAVVEVVATAPATAPATAARPAEATDDSSLGQLRAALAAAADEDARVRAVDALAALGQKARGASDDLVKATADASGRVRWHAARALGMIGEDAVAAVPLLVTLLDDADPLVATQAAAAIGHIRNDDEAKATMPEADRAAYDSAGVALVGKLTHRDPRVRRAVLRALGALRTEPGQYLPLVSQLLADADPSVVLPVLHSVANMGGDAVPFLMTALKNPKTRYWASVALAEIGPAAAPAVSLLEESVATGETEERMQSIMALAAIGDPALPASADIARALDSKETSLRFAAAYALGRLRAKDADGPLEKAAADPDPLLAAVAAWARARIHPEDKGLVTAAAERLAKELSSPKPGIQTAAISALSDLSGSIDDATETQLAGRFVELLSSPEADVREAAAAALVRAGPLAVAPLEKALANASMRGTVTEILAAIGPPSKDAVDSLVAALDDADPAHRGDAAVAIAAVGPAAAEAVGKLDAILRAPDAPTGLRCAAAYALGRIGPAAKPAAATLRSLAATDDELMATVAVWAALKIEPGDTTLFSSAVPLLRRALASANDMARLEAAVALGDIGASAAGAVPILELVSEEDPLPAVRSAAKDALDRIRAAAPQQKEP